MHLSRTLTIAGLAVCLLALSGCAEGYYDEYGYWHSTYNGGYYRDRYHDGEGYYHSRAWHRPNGYYDSYDHRYWVCDTDGDDCRWVYDTR